MPPGSGLGQLGDMIRCVWGRGRGEVLRVRMKVKARPEDFIVEEALRVRPGDTGDYAVYRVTKRMLTTLELQTRIARLMEMPPRMLAFPGLKDKRAVATQHFSFRGRGPSELSGEGFVAQFIGRMDRQLGPGDLAGNRFRIRVRGMEAEGGSQPRPYIVRLEEMGREGLPNYFDEQRFASYTPGGSFFGKAVLRGDAEGALRAYLAQAAPGDPPALRSFKERVRERWGEWQALFEGAPRSNHRSVLNFLKDHPGHYRKALNLITPGLLPILLSAYQSFLWNRIASRFLERKLEAAGAHMASVEVAGERLALYRSLPEALREELKRLSLPMPHHRMAFENPDIEAVALEALEEEGLTLNDLKARLLERAYLSRVSRPLLVTPSDIEARAQTSADGETALDVSFFLPPGSYATLVLKAMEVNWE
jgi:tRNA pseudouridine13 synthase